MTRCDCVLLGCVTFVLGLAGPCAHGQEADLILLIVDATRPRLEEETRVIIEGLKRTGRRHDRTVGSHKIMKKDGWADDPFSFHDSEELGPVIPGKISKKTGLQPQDL